MLLQKEKQSIEEIGKKDKKIYERRKVSLSNIYDLLFPQKSRKYFRTNAKEHIREVSSVKVSFCTSFRGKIKKGSLAVETALVLPLFFLGMVTLISFMDIYKLQTEHLTALCTKAKQAGMYAYLPGGDSVDDITLPDIYTYKPFGGLIPLPDVVVYNHVKVHAWTGTEFPDNGGEQGETEPMVYVTASGSVYHKNPGCSYLNVSLKQIPGSSAKSASNKYGEHYSACEICSRNQNPAGVVYVTEQGNRYHNLESCSGLKLPLFRKWEHVAGVAEFCRRDVYGDEWRKRNMCTWISGNKFMDRYQKKAGFSSADHNICSLRNCVDNI